MLRAGVGVLLLWLSFASFAAAPNIAFFYGPNAPWDELHAFDIVVVEPGHNIDVAARTTPRTQLFAYISVGEVSPDRPYAKEIPKEWLAGTNRPWGTVVIDQTRPEWPRFFVDRVVAPLWQAGYRGFFLDNLDSFHFVAKTEEERVGQQQGLIAVIREIRARFPEAKLIFNRGFEILPQVHREAFAVAAESVFRGWSPKGAQYVEVSESDRKWLLGQLHRVRDEYKLPVIAIDYVAPGSLEAARETAKRITGLGFIPWVANSELDQIGIGAIEVMPRKVLMLYDGDGNEFSLYEDRIHALATMPLNYLGYAVEYVDINRGLPQAPLAGRYAGVVMWFGDNLSARKPGLREWLGRQRAAGTRMAILGTLPFMPTDPLARSFGISGGALARAPQQVSIEHRDPLIGFEMQPILDRRFFVRLQSEQSTVLLRLRSDAGDTMDAAAFTAWGGYALSPYDIVALPRDAGTRWIVQPIEFMRRALALPAMPVPDVTTENGRRLMLAHIDGDGFVNRAEFVGTPFAGDVLLRQVLEKYRIPHSVSIIQGEIAPNGMFPKESPQLEQIARRIFALPHVEIASHTFSHPFRWSPASATADSLAYNLAIPGYTFDLNAEIGGSIDYINTRLAPAGKRTQLIFWTGDTNPGRNAVELAYRAGVMNLNGGGADITRANPTLSSVWPLGMPRGPYFQVYAPNHNENVYTNLWTGPFYGYERAIETFELTERPYRLKPINIYYHAYSASKRASLNALDRVYQWALRQQVMNIYASEYAQKVLDFNRAVVARTADGWLIRTSGALREVRAPVSLGTPDIAASQNIAGYSRQGNEQYIHLADGEARLRFGADSPRQPYIVDANARIERWQRNGSTIQFALQGHVPLRFSLGNVGACRVSADGKPLSGIAQGGITRYEMKQNGSDRISITCAS